jgi:serine/threonine-protein kinase
VAESGRDALTILDTKLGVATVPTAVAMPPGTVIDEYVVQKPLGRGSGGAVYSAVHRLIGKQAALKVFHAASTNARELERFLEEARAVNRIGHPNIVDAFAFGTLPDGRSYIAMELLKGESLATRMSRPGPKGDIARALVQVCDALAAAHAQSIVHRDLKPENIFLADRVKLLDFGLARPLGHDANTRGSGGAFAGTPRYVAPEQARGEPVDARSDIYSLGVVAFEAILGRPPFDADNTLAVIAKHLHDPPPPPEELWPQIPKALSTVLSAALDKQPGKRPTLAELKDVLSRSDIVAALDGFVVAPKRPWWVVPGAVVTAALLVAVLVAISVRAPAPVAVAQPEERVEVDLGTPELLPNKTTATLAFNVTPAGARIWVDGAVLQGTRIEVPPSSDHDVRVVAPGHLPLSRKVHAAAAGTMLPVNVRLPVVRKRAGASKGADDLHAPEYGGSQ